MQGHGYFLVGIYLLVLAIVAVSRVRPVKSRVFFLLRAFFPSWKFFEDCGYMPILQARTKNTEWQTMIEQPKKKVWFLFFFPRGNFCLAAQSLVQQFVSDLDELVESHLSDSQIEKELTVLVSYRLVSNLAETLLAERSLLSGDSFQFRILISFPGEPDRPPEELIRSPQLSVGIV